MSKVDRFILLKRALSEFVYRAMTAENCHNVYYAVMSI